MMKANHITISMTRYDVRIVPCSANLVTVTIDDRYDSDSYTFEIHKDGVAGLVMQCYNDSVDFIKALL